MTRSSKQHLVATTLAGIALALSAGSAAAARPAVESSTRHVERPFIDCPGFTVLGIWDIDRKVTSFFGDDGVAIRDIERVDYEGRLVNPTTGAWVADSGSKTYFDTLAPDGSYLTTYGVEVRNSDYVHLAGRTDFQTGEFRGHDGFAPTNIDALCEALGA